MHEFMEAVLSATEGQRALTHRSYAAEKGEPNNERLEFLGDAVLELIVTEMLYERFPDLQEGELAKLRTGVVRTSSLAEMAKLVGLPEHVKLGKGEKMANGQNKVTILADTFEACLAAIYMENGLDELLLQFSYLFNDRITEVNEGPIVDAKTKLQEVIVRRYGVQPTYHTTGQGPDHMREFRSTVSVTFEVSRVRDRKKIKEPTTRGLGLGHGTSKKEAEGNAAANALIMMGVD